MFNTHSNNFICRYIECVTSHKRIASGVAVRGEGGVAGEGRVVGVPKFHFWGMCTMSLMNLNSDRMSNASFGLFIIYLYYLYFASSSWGVINCGCGVNSLHKNVLCSSYLTMDNNTSDSHLGLPRLM